MGDGDEILHQLLLWTQFFRVHDQQLALVGLAQMHKQLIPKTGQPILMGEHNPLNLPLKNGIHESYKCLSLVIQAAADFHDPLIHLDTTLAAKVSQDGLLVG